MKTLTRSSDHLVRDFYAIRKLRDDLLRERNSLLCERNEAGPPDDWDWDNGGVLPEHGEPCWKTARRWHRDEDGEPTRGFYFDPLPSAWCASCQQRQKASDGYRDAVRRHGAALRGLMVRGAAVLRREQADNDSPGTPK